VYACILYLLKLFLVCIFYYYFAISWWMDLGK